MRPSVSGPGGSVRVARHSPGRAATSRSAVSRELLNAYGADWMNTTALHASDPDWVDNCRTNSPAVGSQFVPARARIFLRRLANLRQVDWGRGGSPFAEASEPGGSRNGSTEMRS